MLVGSIYSFIEDTLLPINLAIILPSMANYRCRLRRSTRQKNAPRAPTQAISPSIEAETQLLRTTSTVKRDKTAGHAVQQVRDQLIQQMIAAPKAQKRSRSEDVIKQGIERLFFSKYALKGMKGNKKDDGIDNLTGSALDEAVQLMADLLVVNEAGVGVFADIKGSNKPAIIPITERIFVNSVNTGTKEEKVQALRIGVHFLTVKVYYDYCWRAYIVTIFIRLHF